MTRKVLAIAVLSLSILGVVGCAGAPRRATLDIPEVRARLPMEQTWPEVERVMVEQGWGIELREGYKLASPWRRSAEAAVATAGQMEIERLVAVGHVLADGRSAVRFARQRRFVQEEGFVAKDNLGHGGAFLESKTFGDGADPEFMHASKRQDGPRSPIIVERVLPMEIALVHRLHAKVTARR